MVDDGAVRQVSAYREATKTFRSWISGMEAVSLLRAASNAGLLRALLEPKSAEELARQLGLESQAIEFACRALQEYGIVVAHAGRYAVAETFSVLLSDTALQSIDDALDYAEAWSHAISHSLNSDRDYWSATPSDRMAWAKGASGIDPTSLHASALVRMAHALPEASAVANLYRSKVQTLEIGCGVASRLLAELRAYPSNTGVGIDLAGDLIAEARRRADIMSLSDRVEFRHMDVRDLTDESMYHSVFWSQFYFPDEVRADVLRVTYRALKLGGVLIAPAPAEPPAGEPFVLDRRDYWISNLVFNSWNVSLRGVEALQTELEIAGFSIAGGFTRPNGAHVVLATKGVSVAQRSNMGETDTANGYIEEGR